MKEATNTHGYKSIYTLYYTPTTTQWYGVQEWKFIRNDGKQQNILSQKHNQPALVDNSQFQHHPRSPREREDKRNVCWMQGKHKGSINPCTTESASSIFFSIETSLKPYQKYLGTFERVVWRCDMKYCLACSDAVVLMFKIKQFIVASGLVHDPMQFYWSLNLDRSLRYLLLSVFTFVQH